MEFCNGIVSLFHTRRHATTAAFRSIPGTIILKTAHIYIYTHIHTLCVYIYIYIHMYVYAKTLQDAWNPAAIGVAGGTAL